VNSGENRITIECYDCCVRMTFVMYKLLNSKIMMIKFLSV
jgi:hypothetical protein